MKPNRFYTFLPFLMIYVGLTCIKGSNSVCKTEVSAAEKIKTVPETKTKPYFLKDNSAETISVIGVGDIMLGTNFPSSKFLPPADHENLLRPVKDLFTGADLSFGNLEGTILNDGGTQKTCKDSNVCYLFRMPERLAPYLKNNGIDVMSMANNHSGDFGIEGRNNTMRILDSLKIGTCGLLVHPYCIIRKNNINYGIIAFAPNSGTLEINSIDSAKIRVAELRTKCDILIVSFHGGGEGRSRQHIVKACEMFCGEKRGNVCQFAHAVIDAGADIVFGQGPHVPRAMELYRNKIIAYSLGNFCTYSRFSLKGECSYAPLLKIFIDKNGDFKSGKIYSFIQRGEGGPVPDPKNMAFKTIKNLSEEDISPQLLVFKNGGKIEKAPARKNAF